MMDAKMSRRAFLSASALASAATGAALFGCTVDTPSSDAGEDRSWDYETDVLVVGSGTAAFSALLAKKFGAGDVMIIEKSPMWGGTSAYSGFCFWTPLFYYAMNNGSQDTREDAIAYMKAVGQGRANLGAIEKYVDNANAFLEWTRDELGWDWILDYGYQDYYELYEGSNGMRTAIPNPEVHTEGLWNTLKKEIDKAGITVMLETPAKKLIQDETGAVIGVEAEDHGKLISIKARKFVVLGTGGFDHDAELIRDNQAVRPYVSCAIESNTGDGQKMGAAIGAALSNMDTNWGTPAFLAEPFEVDAPVVFSVDNIDWAFYSSGAGSLVVNKNGKRFCNEANCYPLTNVNLGNFNNVTMGHDNMPSVFICDSLYRESGLPGMMEPGVESDEVFFKANTIEEIADHFGIDAQVLQETIAEFNANALEGVDPLFGRGEGKLNQTYAAYHPYPQELKNTNLAPISTPPFYGALFVPGTCGTSGGLKVDENAQVLNVNGEVIPGLLAVGNCSSRITGYCGGGMTLGMGSVMGWIGVRNKLGL